MILSIIKTFDLIIVLLRTTHFDGGTIFFFLAAAAAAFAAACFLWAKYMIQKNPIQLPTSTRNWKWKISQFTHVLIIFETNFIIPTIGCTYFKLINCITVITCKFAFNRVQYSSSRSLQASLCDLPCDYSISVRVFVSFTTIKTKWNFTWSLLIVYNTKYW